MKASFTFPGSACLRLAVSLPLALNAGFYLVSHEFFVALGVQFVVFGKVFIPDSLEASWCSKDHTRIIFLLQIAGSLAE